MTTKHHENKAIKFECYVDTYSNTYACFDTCDIIPHRIETCFSGVDLDNPSQFLLSPLKLVLPIFSVRLAELHKQWLWVYPPLQHILVGVNSDE